MKDLLDKLGQSVAQLLLPVVLLELVKLVEAVVKLDLNKDGTIGFGGDHADDSQ